jgi:hypothetical protein
LNAAVNERAKKPQTTMMMLSEQRHFTGFTDHLKQSLLVSRSAVDRWVEEEKALADAAAAQSNQQLAQRQREVDAAVTHWLAVQLESGLSVNAQTKESSSPSNISKKKRELQNKVEQAQHDVEMLRDALDEKRSMLEGTQNFGKKPWMMTDLSFIAVFSFILCSLVITIQTALRAEHTREQARAKEAVQLKQKIEASKATTVNDLTRGIVNYKYLGLDFEKAEQERLR